MSESPKETSDLPSAEPPLCESVCESSPDSAPSGEPEALGPEPVREPPQPEAANAPASAATPDTGQPGAPQPALCPRCGAHVPEGAGRCPGCGIFQKENVESVVHGLRSKKLAKIVDQYRVDLIAQLFAERGGAGALDTVSRIAIENYALVCAQHKTIEARLDQDGLFTQTGRRRNAFDMLKGISETIDRLRAQLPPILSTHHSHSAATLVGLTREQLREKLQERLNRLQQMLDLVEPAQELDSPAPYVARERHEANAPVVAKPASPPNPEARCQYGCGTLTRCEEIKSTRLDVWETIHGRDPEVIKKKDKEATAEMMSQLGKPKPWL
jgi:hypothetical protein